MKDKNYTRRGFLQIFSAGAVAAGGPGAASQPAMRTIYIGTYTSGESEGVYIARMNTSTGALKITGSARHSANPSFLAIDPQGRYLYAADEIQEFEGKPCGAVTAFAIDRANGGLRHLNRQFSHGGAPCYVMVDKSARHVLVANYSGGNAAVLPIHSDGSLGEATSVVQHEGSSINEERQEAPHAHSILLDAENGHAFVCDLGLDRVMVYAYDGEAGRLGRADTPWVSVKPGAGPRHLAFHPDGKSAYVVNELDSTLTVFAYGAKFGRLTERKTVSMLPDDFSGENSGADVHVHPTGRFLYASNRGHDSIAVFAIDDRDGGVTLIQHESTQGEFPRNFAIDPSGTFLLAANQKSDSIVSFRINPDSGRLSPTGHRLEVPIPVCVRFG